MASARVIHGGEELSLAVGEELGVSDWMKVDQRMIDDFAKTTGDTQWIHVNPDRARTGPFGATIAHGFLVLSLIPVMANQVYDIRGFAARINYGVERVRFPQALRSGGRIRDRVSVESVDPTPNGVRVTFGHQVEPDAGDRPVCVAKTVILFTA